VVGFFPALYRYSYSLQGDMVHVNLMGMHVLILNSAEVASNLLERKGKMYSDRHSLYFVNELVGYRESFILMNDGPELRQSRRLCLQALAPRVISDRFAPMMETRTRQFLLKLLDTPFKSPEELSRHVRQ
jgi:cytochrome P450